MVIPAPDPVSAISSTINATIKILEITYELKAVDEQTADLLSTTRHVDSMLQQAHRLRRQKAGLLNASERTMIDTVISDTEDALRAVAKLVEPCRADMATRKTIRFGHRVMWLIRDNPSVRDKHQMLQICYQSLTVAFNCLYSKDVAVIAPIPEVTRKEQPPPYDPRLKELFDWQNRRKGRKGLGESESPSDENLGLTNRNSNVVTVVDPSSPCLLGIELDDHGGTSSLFTELEVISESLAMPTSDAQPSVLPITDIDSRPATSTPTSSGASLHFSTHDYSPDNEGRTASPSLANKRTDDVGQMHTLPEIDISPFITMIAPYNFGDDVKDVLHVEGKNLQTSIPALDQAPSPTAVSLDTTPSLAPWFPSLPHLTSTMPSSSESKAVDALGLRYFESSVSDRYETQQSTEISSLEQHPRRARVNSDIQPSTAYLSDRLDAIASVEDVMTRDEEAASVGKGGMKRSGRSWLAYHATRSDTRHELD